MNPIRSLFVVSLTLLSIALFSIAMAPAAQAQGIVPVPVGGPLLLRETQLHPDDSTVDYFDPSFAGRPGGGFLAGWSRVVNGAPDPDEIPDEIQAQAYNHLDREVGPTRVVSDEPDPADNGQRQLALDSSGGRAVAVWGVNEGSDFAVQIRFLNSAGQPTSPQVTAGLGTNRQPAVAIAPSGVALVVWTRFENPRLELVGRIFDSQGNPLTGEIDIDGGIDVADSASVDVDDDGNFLIAWDDSFLADSVVHAKWINGLGQTVVPTFEVGGPNAADPSVSVVPDGRAVVAWTTCNESGEARTQPCDVRYRLLGTDGLPAAPSERVSPLDGRAYEQPAVGANEDGDFAIAWRACQLNPVGARFDCLVTTSFHAPNGDRYGNRLQMARNGEPTRFDVVPLGDDFVIGWFRFSCDSMTCDPGFESVYAQRYRLIENDAPGGAGDGPDLYPEIPDGAPALTSPDFPDFRFFVRIGRSGSDLYGNQEPECLPETICVSGALPGRTEVELRIIGPRPNGYLWPTIVKFTTSTVEVWVEQISTGKVRYYGLDGATQGSSELPGLFDRMGFLP